jgi:hypothetical protein
LRVAESVAFSALAFSALRFAQYAFMRFPTALRSAAGI